MKLIATSSGHHNHHHHHRLYSPGWTVKYVKHGNKVNMLLICTLGLRVWISSGTPTIVNHIFHYLFKTLQTNPEIQPRLGHDLQSNSYPPRLGHDLPSLPFLTSNSPLSSIEIFSNSNRPRPSFKTLSKCSVTSQIESSRYWELYSINQKTVNICKYCTV